MGIVSLSCLVLLPLLLLLPSLTVVSAAIVKNLPGFAGELPFKLETGYVTVGKSEMFYYFVESEGRPHIDPIILYFNGGPGCSGLNGLFYQAGPLAFNLTDYSGGLPQLFYYPYSWTKIASVIFLDAPVGTGFSYPTTVQDVNSSDSKFALETYGFLKKWMIDHPEFRDNQFFLSSDSYAGMITPIIAQYILNGNRAGVEPYINLNGYICSAPHTLAVLQGNWRIPFAHRMALISDRQYESLKTSCKGNYVSNTSHSCKVALQAYYTKATELINLPNILEPYCSPLKPKPEEDDDGHRRSLWELLRGLLHSSLHNTFWCRNFKYLLSTVWGNFKSVQDALNVRKGTMVSGFHRCSLSLVDDHYDQDISNAIPYHKNLTKSSLQVLIFIGDHDMEIPHLSVEDWVASLGVALDIDWSPWFVSGQVAGYTRRYAAKGYALTYATIKGAGHSPQEYKRRECYELLRSWVRCSPAGRSCV